MAGLAVGVSAEVICNDVRSFTYCSDGTSSQRIGNMTFNSDGSSSNRVGDMTYNSVEKSVPPVVFELPPVSPFIKLDFLTGFHIGFYRGLNDGAANNLRITDGPPDGFVGDDPKWEETTPWEKTK